MRKLFLKISFRILGWVWVIADWVRRKVGVKLLYTGRELAQYDYPPLTK